jgi:hypothetical protein
MGKRQKVLGMGRVREREREERREEASGKSNNKIITE